MTRSRRNADRASYSELNLSLERTAVRFISLVLANKKLRTLCRDYDFDNLLFASTDIEVTELIPMAVELATCYRLIFWNSSCRTKTSPVGCLIEHDDSINDLTLIEACNKIIHAETLSFKTRKVRNFPLDYIEPELEVTGAKGKKKWRAVIDLVLFTNEILTSQSEPLFAEQDSA